MLRMKKMSQVVSVHAPRARAGRSRASGWVSASALIAVASCSPSKSPADVPDGVGLSHVSASTGGFGEGKKLDLARASAVIAYLTKKA
jgi:hypothetical protein